MFRERVAASQSGRALRDRGWSAGPSAITAWRAVRPFDVSESHLGFDEYDLPVQGLVSHHYWLRGGDIEYGPVPFRYVWPSELDLMARLAGMTLLERWSNWER